MVGNTVSILKQYVFDERYTKLDTIFRFNGTFTHIKESVSQHSFWVSFYTRSICKLLNYDSKLTLDCLEYAILHDLSEVFDYDVSFEVKYNSHNGSQIRALLDEFIDYSSKDLLIFDDIQKFKTKQDYLIIYYTVKVADNLACFKHEHQEILVGNVHMKGKLEKSIVQTEKFCHLLIDSLYKSDKLNKLIVEKFDLIQEVILKNIKQIQKSCE